MKDLNSISIWNTQNWLCAFVYRNSGPLLFGNTGKTKLWENYKIFKNDNGVLNYKCDLDISLVF